MANLSFHPGFSGGMLVASGVAAVILIALFYRRAFTALRLGPWLTLYGLRVLAVAIVLLLLFRPVFSVQRENSRRRQLVFVVDSSASMSIADQATGGTRLQQAVDRLVAWQGTLAPDFDCHWLTFSDTARSLDAIGQLQSLDAAGQATSVSRALGAAVSEVPARELECVFLVSDGLHNSAGNPVQVAQSLGVPVHAIGVGASLRDGAAYRDARVTGLEVPSQMSVDHRARIEGFVEAVGLPGRVVTAVLTEDGQQVAEQELVLDDTEGTQQVTFEFSPTTQGLHTYSMEVPVAAEEKIAQNNRRSTTGLVIDARIRVLYVEGTLRAEYGAIVGRFLAKDPNLEFCALVQTRPNVFQQRTNIDDLQLTAIPSGPQLESFDVFVLGDLDSSYLSVEQMESIAKRVRDGGGLMMLGGYHGLGPGGYADTPLGALLPVFVGDRQIGQSTDPFPLQLTADGRNHPIFANIGPFFPGQNAAAEVEGLPDLEGCVRVQGVRPSATVLAVNAVGEVGAVGAVGGAAPLPVLAVHPVGRGRAAVFTADTTRRWHQAMRTMDRETPFLRFWGQAIRWLAGRSDDVPTEAGISATTDKSWYEPESAVVVTAVVRGSEGEAAAGAEVFATLQRAEQPPLRVNLAPVPGPAGNYRTVFEPRESGRYQVQVRAQLEDVLLEAEPIEIEVGRANLEFDRLDLDDKLLAAVAQASGGRYAHLSTADRLIDGLQRAQQKRQVKYEVALAWPPLLWVMFVGVLTTEWILRKRYHLR